MEFTCNICPRKCNKIRNEIKGEGFCQMPYYAKISRYSLHKWEEPCISGKQGSGAIFFTGCNLKCVYCQNSKITQGSLNSTGKIVSIDELAEMCNDLINQGAHNLNFVTPSHYIEILAKLLTINKFSVPIVYNSSGYDDLENLKKLNGLIDVYLPDLKYFDSDISTKYSHASNYFDIAKDAIFEMYNQVGDCVFDDDGMIKKGVIVRHLILPNNVNNTINVLKWCKENLPSGVMVSVMAQYIPSGNLNDFPELQRKINKIEYNRVVNYMLDNNIENGYIQDMSSASCKYIPDFY